MWKFPDLRPTTTNQENLLGQQLFDFQSPAVHCMSQTSSLNCLSDRNPYQTPPSVNAFFFP